MFILQNNQLFKNNNFDLLRFIFALIVLLTHAYDLSKITDLKILIVLFSSEIAVKSFFVISGFLIFKSYENSEGLRDYFSKRIRRIYPGYIAVILACSIFGALISNYSSKNYFMSVDLYKYIVANLTFLNFIHPNLPGVFIGNEINAVNGALWTLKIEVMFYCSVPLFAMAFKKFGHINVLITIYLLSIFYSLLMSNLAEQTDSMLYLELRRQLPGQLTFFVAGAIGYYYFSFFVKYGTWLFIIALAMALFKQQLPWFLLEPIWLGILVLYFACIFPSLGNFAKYGDISYGIYITHFPILQTLIASGLFLYNPYLGLGFAIFLVLSSSFILWHGIEKRYLLKRANLASAKTNC